MEEAMSFESFKNYVKKTIHFGEMKTKIFPKEDGYKIEIWEHDEYELLDEQGNETGMMDGDTTKPYSIFTDENEVIGVIEHRFQIMTRANKDAQIHMLNLIGTKVEIPSSEVLDAIALPTEFQKQFRDFKKKLKEFE